MSQLHWVVWLACLQKGESVAQLPRTDLTEKQGKLGRGGNSKTLRFRVFIFSFDKSNETAWIGSDSLEYHEKLLNNNAVKY